MVNNPEPVANYNLDTPLKYQKNPGTYRHPELGVDVYLVDDTLVPGQVYTPEKNRPRAVTTLKSIIEAEDYDGPNFSVPTHEPTVTVVEQESEEEEESSYIGRDFTYRRPSRSSRDEHHHDSDSDSESDHSHHSDSDSESDHSDSDSDDEDYLGDYNIGDFKKFGRRPTYSSHRRTSSRRGSDDSDDEGYTRSYSSSRSSRPTSSTSSRSTRSYTKPASKDIPASLSSAYGTSWLDALF